MYKYIYWLKKSPQQKYKPVILITGCGSGIGLALAELFYPLNQYRVCVTARKRSIIHLKNKFQENENFKIFELDVNNLDSRLQLIQDIQETWGPVDILINNAGISFRSVVEHMTEEDELLQMNTNYFGPMALIRLVLPSMRAKGRGKIINISSVSGMLAMPTMASYSASKYALEGATESLWYEMRPFGVDVCLVQPGFIKSESFKNVYYSEKAWLSELSEGPYSLLYQSMSPFVAKLMKLSRSNPERIAELILDVIQTIRPPLWIPATFDAEFFYYLRRLMPRRLIQPFLFYCLPGTSRWGENFTYRRHGIFYYIAKRIYHFFKKTEKSTS